MATANFVTKKIVINIVLFGPPQCGKKTFISFAHSQIAPSERGLLHTESNFSGENIYSFFWNDLAIGKFKDFSYCLNLQACSLSVDNVREGTPSESLARADALIFMADSTETSSELNQQYLSYLIEELARNGSQMTSGQIETDRPLVRIGKQADLEIKTTKTPLRILFNKRDVSGACSLDALASFLEPSIQVYEGIAKDGLGVHAILKHSKNSTIYGVAGLRPWYEDLT